MTIIIVIVCCIFIMAMALIISQSDDFIEILFLGAMTFFVSFVISLLVVILLSPTDSASESQERETEINTYCEEAVIKGNFTSKEECLYILEKY